VSPSLERTRLSSQRKMRRRKNILLPFSLKRTLCLVPREEEEDAAVTQSVEEAIIAQSNDDAVLDTVQSDEDVALGARRGEGVSTTQTTKRSRSTRIPATITAASTRFPRVSKPPVRYAQENSGRR
jgi:hypothetical protein